jgi:hypothetical protein
MILLLTVLFKHESIYISRTPEVAVEVSGYIIELNVKIVVDPTGFLAGSSLPNIVEIIPFPWEKAGYGGVSCPSPPPPPHPHIRVSTPAIPEEPKS